jgi:hypothetical protein
MPFSIHIMAWSGKHRAFVVDEFMENGGFPIMTQRAFAVNKQNFRHWSYNNPWELHQRSLHSPKITVWCAIF